MASPYAYWMVILPEARGRPELDAFAVWIRQQAESTRRYIGERP